MALPPVNGRPKGPARTLSAPKQVPTGPTAPTSTLPDPIERNKSITVKPQGLTGSADVMERGIEFQLEEERLASAEGRAKELGIPVPAGGGLEKYKGSPYYKETTNIGQIVFTDPRNGKDVYYDPETGLVPGLENYGVSRDFIMDNLPEDPIERNAVLDWLEESDKQGGKLDLGKVGLDGKTSDWFKTITNPLALVGVPGRTVVAGIEQLTNIPSGTASLTELTTDVLDPTYGFGSFTGDLTGNKWLDRAIGLAGDIVTDPTNLILPGGTQIADIAVTGATRIASRDVGKLLTEEAGQVVLRAGVNDALRTAGVADDVIESLVKSASDIKIAKAGIESAVKSGDQAANAAARAAEQLANEAFNKSAAEIAKVIKVGRGGKISLGAAKAGKIIAAGAEQRTAFSVSQAAKQALDVAIASGDDVAIKAARTVYDEAQGKLNAAINKVAAQGNIRGIPVRKYGEKARLALASEIKQIRARALRDAADTTLDVTTRNEAQAVADVLTDQAISKVATEGWSSIRGELADALGVRSGLRIGTKRANIRLTGPASGILADSIGEGVTKARLKLQGIFGDKFLKVITPIAKSGPVDPETIIEMRTALRTGKAGADAVNFLNIISFNDAVIRARSIANSRASRTFNAIFKKGDSRIANNVVPYLSADPSQWASLGLRTPTAAELDLITRVKTAMDFWYNEANALHKALGNIEDLPRVDNYFPLTQTDVFSDWATRNPVEAIGIGQAVQPTVVDPTWVATNFMERQLVPGKVWFGHTLTPQDLAGGPARLNQIARESGVFGKRNIDVFEERLIPAVQAYASKHARYIAFGRTALDITNPTSSYLDTFRRAFIAETQGVSNRTLRDIDNLEATVKALFSPSRLQDWSPDDIDEVLNRLMAINDVLDDAVRSGATTPINAEQFRAMVADAEQYVTEINRAIASGDYPENLIPLAINELDNFALNAINEIQEIGVKAITLPSDKWKDVVNIAETGFEVLNYRTIPNITARNEVYDLLTNVRRLDNPGVAREFSNLANAYQQWWKSWVLATPRYVRRNGFSDTFQLLLAGANLKEASKAFRIWSNFLKSNNSAEIFALTLNQADRQLFLDVVSTIPEEVTKDRGNLTRIALGGRTLPSGGEVAGELVPGSGIFGGRPTGRIPIIGRYGIGPQSNIAARISQTAALPVNYFRTVSGNIGDIQRFILTWDGLAKGMSLESAVNRTNKYLIDYTSTSKFDDVVKRTVMPFWMFASRNLPMQYENMLRHPRVFNRYNYLKKFLSAQGEDKEPYQSDISTRAGAFQLDPDIVKALSNEDMRFWLMTGGAFLGGFTPGGTLPGFQIGASGLGASQYGVAGKFTPDFGFPGGGRPNELLTIPREILATLGITDKPSSTVLSQLPAPLRTFLEIATNRKFYSGADLISSYSELTPPEQRAAYALSQTVPQLSWLGQVPWLRRSVDLSNNAELAALLGIPLTFTSVPEGEPGSEEARIARAKEKAVAQLYGWFGSPVLPMTEAEQTAEIARRRRALEALIAEEEQG